MKILSRQSTIKGGRNGKLQNTDKSIDLSLVPPKEMGGKGEGADPESLFVSGYISCLSSSMEYLLANDAITYESLTMEGRVDLMGDPTGGFKFALDVRVTVEGLDEATARDYLQKAKNFCPYSKAIEGNVDVQLTLEVR